MHVRLVTPHFPLAESVAQSLRDQGHEVDVRPDTVTDSELRYGPSTTLEAVTGLIDQIKPLLPAVVSSDDLDTDVELRLGDRKPFGSWEVKLQVDSEPLGQRLKARLDELGFRHDGLDIEPIETDKIQFGGATPLARQVVRWLLHAEGVDVIEQKSWGEDDDDIWVSARDPELLGKTPRQRVPVELIGDDMEALQQVKERLLAAGFERVTARAMDGAERPKFKLDRGPLHAHLEDVADLEEVVQTLLAEREVDPERHPLVHVPRGEEHKGHAALTLPLGAHAAGTLRPWEGPFPERWDIHLHTDKLADARPLVATLQEAGFPSVRVQALSESALGFAVRGNRSSRDLGVLDSVHEHVLELLETMELDGDEPFPISDSLPDEDDRIVIELPIAACARSTFEERVKAAASGWELTLKSPRPDDYPDLIEALGGFPWKQWSREVEGEVEPKIQYGGAPVAVVEVVRGLVETHTGHRLPLSKAWGDGDDDIWVHLPRGEQTARAEDDAELDLTAWLSEGLEVGEPTSLVQVDADQVRIGPVTLPRRTDGPTQLVPRPEAFAHYCLDQRTAETLLHAAESVLLREPCLLEGETSVSKTSIVQFLALQVGQPVVRLNLNGQTDTGELVGRYVPQDSAAALPLDPSELLAAAELLESESRMILERAATAGRTLTRVEVQQIMANERMIAHPWRWQDGLVVTAMKQGWWVVLDELNLAEPQILERLNPVLERDPSLVLTEHDNSVIGGSGHPVHPHFRVFATMNPAEYAGRSPLSPAYRDRWRAYRFVPAPGESEYLSMLRFLVHGVQPDVSVQGRSWLGKPQQAPLAALAEVEGIDDFLRALARFHAALEEAVGRRGGSRANQLGGRRRERYVFSRRGLLSVVDYLASHDLDDGGVPVLRRALARYYLGRVQPGADQRVVARLLDAAGIGPNTWAPDRLDQLGDADGADGEE